MAQNPLPPPPPSGGVLDGWLYLLWRRLTQAGQILWESITPGTSADVAAAVTDETGSPGSLVFSGNPTLAGVNVATGDCAFNVTSTGTMYIGDVANKAAYSTLVGSTVTTLLLTPRAGDTIRNNVNMYLGEASITPMRWRFYRGRGGTSHGAVVSGDVISELQSAGSDGTSFLAAGLIKATVNGAVSAGVVPVDIVIFTGSNSAPPESFRAQSNGTVTLGGSYNAPALKVTPVASQARWIEITGATSSTNPTIGVSGGNLATSAVFMPVQATTAGAPAYVLGGMYFDTTLNKLRIGGATAWETVTSL